MLTLLSGSGDRPGDPGPADDATEPPRGRSGRVVVLVSVASMLLLVSVFGLVGPRLEQLTLAQAPAFPPVEVASGEVDGHAWTATATEPDDELPCLELRVDGDAVAEICGDRTGASNVRELGTADVAGTAVLLAIVDPRSSQVRAEGLGADAELPVTYADYGFPMGFAAGEVDAARVERVVPVDEEGGARGEADCTRGQRDWVPDVDVGPPTVVGHGSALAGGDGCLLAD